MTESWKNQDGAAVTHSILQEYVSRSPRPPLLSLPLHFLSILNSVSSHPSVREARLVHPSPCNPPDTRETWKLSEICLPVSVLIRLVSEESGSLYSVEPDCWSHRPACLLALALMAKLEGFCPYVPVINKKNKWT